MIKKISEVIIRCLLGLVILILLFIVFVSFTNKKEGVSKFGDYIFFHVKGDSMEPLIKDGDFIVVNGNLKDKYDVGDIVSFLYLVDDNLIVVTHEIVEFIDIQGSYKYLTKGVNNDDNDEKIINHNDILGEYTNFRIPLLGYIVEFGETNVGYWLLVITPLGIVLFVSIYELLKEIEKRKKGEA